MKAQPTAARPSLNTAADSLIAAMESVTDLAGLRVGFANSIGFWGALADPDSPDHRDALELIDLWRALDGLAEAVATRREVTV